MKGEKVAVFDDQPLINEIKANKDSTFEILSVIVMGILGAGAGFGGSYAAGNLLIENILASIASAATSAGIGVIGVALKRNGLFGCVQDTNNNNHKHHTDDSSNSESLKFTRV